MSSMNYVAHELQKLGLSAEVTDETIYCEDIDLDFDRSHDGVRGISKWFAEVKEEYEMAIADLLEDSMDEESAETQEEEMVTDARIEEAQDEAEEFAPAPPEKEHVVDSAQLELAKELSSPKEIAQANDDQDRGGIPNSEDYVVHSEKTEFEVSGIGYVTGEFRRRFTERGVAQNFARACVAAAKSPKYASTIRIATV